MRNLAIIPARKGSKRLPGKNLRKFAGKPLVDWTISAAIKSKRFCEVHVSTDCQEIAECAQGLGVGPKFLRNPDLAQDNSRISDVIVAILAEFEAMGTTFDSFCLLQPTSPLRSEAHIRDAYITFSTNSAVALISVCPLKTPYKWINTLGEKNDLSDFVRSHDANSRSQDFQPYYELNGAIYIRKVADFMVNKTLFPSSGSMGYVMSKKDSIDIDDLEDFEMAEAIKIYQKT